MRVVGVALVALVLAMLAAAAVRGVRRAAWPHDVEDAGRSVTQAIVEGLIVLAVVILGVVVVVAFLD
jgi:L-lactate permease